MGVGAPPKSEAAYALTGVGRSMNILLLLLLLLTTPSVHFSHNSLFREYPTRRYFTRSLDKWVKLYELPHGVQIE